MKIRITFEVSDVERDAIGDFWGAGVRADRGMVERFISATADADLETITRDYLDRQQAEASD